LRIDLTLSTLNIDFRHRKRPFLKDGKYLSFANELSAFLDSPMASGLQNVSYADHIKECHNEFCRFPGLYPSISRNLELTYVKRQIGRPTKIVVRPISGRHWVLPATFAGAKHTNLCLHPNDAWAVAWFQHFEEAKGFFHSTSGLRNVRSGSIADASPLVGWPGYWLTPSAETLISKEE
jgi:hypothetical protein